MKSLKEARYELVEVPERLGPKDVVVDRQFVLDYAYTHDDFQDWYFHDSPFGGPIGHPLVLANELLFLFYEKYDGNTAQGLHTHEQLRFHAPVRIGERVTIDGGYTEKYERRGQGYVTMEAEARGEDGRLLIEHTGREIMRTVAGDVVGKSRSGREGNQRLVLGTVDVDAPVLTSAALNAAERAAIPSRTRHFTQDQMSVFSWAGRGYRNVHTTPSKAARSGLERTIVQAQQQTGLIVSNLVGLFGETWFTSGRLDLRFVSPAYVGDTLSATGAVVGIEGDRLELEVWVTKPDGTKTALGWASAIACASARKPNELL